MPTNRRKRPPRRYSKTVELPPWLAFELLGGHPQYRGAWPSPEYRRQAEADHGDRLRAALAEAFPGRRPDPDDENDVAELRRLSWLLAWPNRVWARPRHLTSASAPNTEEE